MAFSVFLQFPVVHIHAVWQQFVGTHSIPAPSCCFFISRKPTEQQCALKLTVKSRQQLEHLCLSNRGTGWFNLRTDAFRSELFARYDNQCFCLAVCIFVGIYKRSQFWNQLSGALPKHTHHVCCQTFQFCYLGCETRTPLRHNRASVEECSVRHAMCASGNKASGTLERLDLGT